MSRNVSWNGQSWPVPNIGDGNWGGTNKLDGLIVSIAENSLQKTGGLFSLSADVDWGASAGHEAMYYKSRENNVAESGRFRMANNSSGIAWRNAADDADLALTVDATDVLKFNGVPVSSLLINVVAYGALGDGSTDDTAAIQDAIDAADALTTGARIPVLYFPPGYTSFKITSALQIPENIDVIMETEVLYVGSSNITAITIGQSGAPNGPRYFKLNVRRNTQADWTSESNIGVKLFNVNTSHVWVNTIRNFTINLKVIGSGTHGCAYNNFYLGDLQNAKVGVDLDSALSGWVNENLFLGGRLGAAVGTNATLRRYGIRIWSSDGTYVGNNNNIFQKPSFEMGGLEVTGDVTNGNDTITNIADTSMLVVGDEILTGYFPIGTTVLSKTSTSITCSVVANGGSAVATTIGILRGICAWMVHASGNKVYECRSEGNNLNMLTANNSDQNEFFPSFNDYNVGSFDRSAYVNFDDGLGVVGTSYKALRLPKYQVLHFPDLRNKIGPINSSGYAMCPGLSWKNNANATISLASPAAVSMGTLTISITSSMAIGAVVDTTFHKRFIMDRQAVTYGGRILIQCFDASGTVLTSADAQHPLVRGQNGDGFTYTTDWGNAYKSDADGFYTTYFEVKDNVKSIWVGVAGGTTTAALTGFSLYSVTAGTPLVRPGYSGKQWYERASDVTPAGGTWAVGDSIKNTTPAVGSPVGWVCTVAGTPGTWVALHNLGGGFAAGSVGTPSVFTTGDTNTGLYWPSSDALAVTTGGTKALHIELGAASYSFEFGTSGSTKDYLCYGAGMNLVGTSASTYLLYRGFSNGILRLMGGSGTSSAYIDLYGGSHGSKPGVFEVSNNTGLGMSMDIDLVVRFKGQALSEQDTESGMTGTTHTINWNDGNSTVLDLQGFSGNVTLTLSNPVAGASYLIKLIQSSTARTITWPATVKWPGGAAPTITATNDAIDVIVLYWDGTNYLGTFQQAYA